MHVVEALRRGQPARLAPRGDQQAAEAQLLAAVEHQRAADGVEALCSPSQQQLHVVVPLESSNAGLICR